jgi:DNA-directed RNA polymerase subunit RPC12/RpoP
MFRCITELKGIAVDIDSFRELDIDDWIEIDDIVPCIFLTAKDDTKSTLEAEFGTDKVIKLSKFQRFFSPNKTTHIEVLKALEIKNTELAYLSCSHSFLENANGFLSGTIWITENVSYQQASNAPDMIRNSVDDLKEALKDRLVGFFGEMALFPGASFPATMLPVDYEVDDDEVPMYVLGRYFGDKQYMNHLHPYSTAILNNKKPDKTYTGVFDDLFKNIYAAAIRTLKDIHGIDSVCAVPVKPGKSARFDDILEGLSNDCGVENIGKRFTCAHDYPDQKSLSTAERESNVKDAFRYQGELNGRIVALIDDIASTGSTIEECIKELKSHGADEVVVILLAINQFRTGSYWSTDMPQVTCPECGTKMLLQVSGSGNFFFSCINCWSNHKKSVSMNFSEGWKQVCDAENEKFDKLIENVENIDDSECFEDETFSLKRIINCPYCNSENEVDIEDISTITSHERQMGTETLYEFNSDDMECAACGREYHIDGYVSEYPQGAFGNETINVEPLEENL